MSLSASSAARRSLPALRYPWYRFLLAFAWVNAMRHELKQDVMYCDRCHGTGEILMPGGTFACPRCHRKRRLAEGMY